MKTFFKDIFEYHNYMNQKLIELFLQNRDQVSEKSIFLFSHSINAHQIWNSRILKTTPVDLNQVHSIEICQSMDNQNYQKTLIMLEEYNLNTEITYQNSKGKKFVNSVEEILFHISNHFTHHKGQIIADLRQNGIEPVITDYIYFKRKEYN